MKELTRFNEIKKLEHKDFIYGLEKCILYLKTIYDE